MSILQNQWNTCIVEHGHVKLVNCRVDVLQFLEYCKEARLHEKKGELWQAQNNFFSAFSLWEDSGINKLNLGENVIFQEAVEQEFLNSSKIWASILINHERTNKATQVLETAFRHFPQDTELAQTNLRLICTRREFWQGTKCHSNL